MFAKLLGLILFVGATAAILLVVRQQRLEAAHEISLGHQRLISLERNLWELRAAVGRRCRPDDVRALIDAATAAWDPIIGPSTAPPLTPIEPAPRDPDDAGSPPAGSPRPPAPTIAARDAEGIGG